MRKQIMIVLAVCIFIAMNYGIYEKQQIIKNGEVMLLKLAPVDPRSLMQGDYMVLNYELTPRISTKYLKKRGDIVITAGENNVAKYIRIHEGELKENEKILHYHKRYSRIRIVPNNFFFQEGHGKIYSQAKYGMFKFDKKGNSLLVGLADKNRVTIKP